MSDILCRWLNEELRLSQVVEPKTFAKDFSSGYLIGEVLHKYQLQNDFNLFMKKDTSISKVNNFTRLEPTLQLLGIAFDATTAQGLMDEKQGVATQILYQLYLSLEKKKKAEISGSVMDIMQPAATTGLRKKEHEIYCDQLHKMVKCEAELKLPEIGQHYDEKHQQVMNRSVMAHPVKQQKQLKVQDEKRVRNTEKLQVCHQKPNDLMPRNQTTLVQVPKPPPRSSLFNLEKKQQQQRQQRKQQQAQAVQNEIAQFETNRKKLATSPFAYSLSRSLFPGDFPLGGSNQTCEVPEIQAKPQLQSNSQYIQEIRQRLQENALAREQREKRVDRFIVEQLKACEAEEDAKRDEYLVKRLTRQTKEEKRLVAHLLQIRKEKELIVKNRLFREQQIQQRRETDFQEALEREAALARQAKLDRAEDIKKEREFCNRIAAERVQKKYEKHFKSCKNIVEQIVDLANKVGEYRQLTGNLIPEKQMREWKELLFSGLPLYEPIETEGQQSGFEFSTALDPVELKKQEILNNQDYDEYTNMVGEWVWPEEAGETQLPPTNNNILGHVVVRLKNIVHPPTVKTSKPSFPHFTLKACVLGKFCTGKTTCLAKIAEAHGIYVLSVDTLLKEAIKAYQTGEEVTEQQGQKDSKKQLLSSSSLKSDLDLQGEISDTKVQLSTRAMQGAAADKEMRAGKAVSKELLVDIIVEAIKQVPANSGWILDGFPVDITQAYLLEKALGGAADVENEVRSSRTNLAVDPDPPKPPPTPAPALDLVLLLDIPDECVITRAYSHAHTAAASKSDPSYKTLYLAQIPQRITTFKDTWPKLEEWFGRKQNILVHVDADVEEKELFRRVEAVLQQIMNQPKGVLAASSPGDVVLSSGNAADSGTSPETFSSVLPPPADQAPALTESYTSRNEEKGENVKSPIDFPQGHAGGASPRSISNEDSQEASKKPSESASPYPGSSSLAYVDEPLPPEISENLCTHWDTVCESYVNNIKAVLQELRPESTRITHHLYNLREEFKHYLERPDLNQELVSQWQKDFNSIADDMRDDEETKAELHQRLDDLRERLWDISDKRKEEDEQELAAVMGDGWLEDHTALIINYHSMLMQAELDRFQDTFCILRIYYLSMCRQVLPVPLANFVCIPLLDTPDMTVQEESNEAAAMKSHNQMNDRGEDTKTLQPAFAKGQTEPVVPPHHKLISDYEEALMAIKNLVSAGAQQREMETKLQKEKQQEKDKPASAQTKNKKEQSAKKKKGAPSPPPPAPSPVPAEEKNPEMKAIRNKMHNEYTAALDHEEQAAKVRIAMVKNHGLVMVQSMQSSAEQTFSSMKQWLEARFVAKMKSIDQLTEVVRHHIESEVKLQNALVLDSTDFYLNGDCHMFAGPPPPSRPPTLEKAAGSILTIVQLESLNRQFGYVAPSGLMSSFDFSSLLRDFTSVNMGRDTLPETWMKMNETQLLEIVSLLKDERELVDWRRFLLSCALPWPLPYLTQLLAMLQHFKSADSGGTGYINEEQYLKIQLWFTNDRVQPVPEDPSEPLPYDRFSNLCKFFFQLFADHSVSPPRLDYVSMLQYFAADPNPKQGFIRALSVVLGQHLKQSSSSHLVKSMPSIEEATEFSSPEADGDDKQEVTPCAWSSLLGDQEVSIPALVAVISHKSSRMKDSERLPPGCMSQMEHTELLECVFRELGYRPEDHVPFSVLSQHPFIQDLMETSTQHQLINIHRALPAHQDEGEVHNRRAS